MPAVGDIMYLNGIQTTPPAALGAATDTQFFKIRTASSNGELVGNDTSSHDESLAASEDSWLLLGSLARSAATLQEYAGPGDVPNPFGLL